MSTTQNMLLAQAATEAAPAAAVPTAPAATAQTTTAVVAAEGKGGFSAKPTVGEIVEFQITGLLVVFVVLGAITLLSSLMSALLKALVPDSYHCKKPAMEAAKAAPAAKPAAAPAATASGLSHDKLLVILAAAAQEVFGKSAMVVSYSAADAGWAMQGRVAHHHSHNPKA